MKTELDLHDNFFTYESYDGLITDDGAGSLIHGFQSDTASDFSKPPRDVRIPAGGGVFGFLMEGDARILFGLHEIALTAGMWFTTENGLDLRLLNKCRVFAVQRTGYRGMDTCGVLQPDGRLKYIDGAMDSILSGPIKFGDPILNALYMPPGVHQTMHTHPSTRCGMIISGRAFCESPSAKHELKPGQIFHLPTNGRHKFRTDETGESLNLIAWHPDSIFGAKDQEHPMLDRTIVDGVSAKDIPSIQTK